MAGNSNISYLLLTANKFTDMNLKDRIQVAEASLIEAQERLKPIKDRYDYLMSCSQPTIEELFSDISEYVKSEIERKPYRHILGGDGRSRPWDEERTGNVLTITIMPKIYLSGSQKNMVREYYSEFITDKEINHVVFDRG